ncbi:Aliphatic sulfonates import ATP-binding protein SsuB [Paenibacillus sp. JJ-100]|uniref:ABC transporter ATP-binding protein n=1 Tax=Paenibacillus sp. JJ-100 TaxID=2974896 RepID=UPI0022FF98F1|nr:ABC transporter ATP-binding protein [Paenibacillus sp. JJ-100]CAI6055742.1 Aliphatic sulfonates import ATP-binding protein SsuB [Paenibacillus sp. JJ-100]
MPDSRNVIRLENISQVYVSEREASLVIEDLSLGINQGEFVSLVGPSGCGKTTLLSIIAGLLSPTRGEVEVEGKLVQGPSARVGYMLQQDYLFPWRTILDNALIGLELTGNLDAKSRERTRELLGSMGLGGTEQQYPSELSGGMRQRVALVRTLATDPAILLLDEPFSALDYQTKLQLEDLVSDTLKEFGKTSVLVTHDLSEAIAVSDRVIVLDRNPGRIRREFEVPEHIRLAQPFHAREQAGFNELFQSLWSELVQSGGGEKNI